MKYIITILLSMFLIVPGYTQEPKKEGTVVNGMRLAKKKEDKKTAEKKDNKKTEVKKQEPKK